MIILLLPYSLVYLDLFFFLFVVKIREIYNIKFNLLYESYCPFSFLRLSYSYAFFAYYNIFLYALRIERHKLSISPFVSTYLPNLSKMAMKIFDPIILQLKYYCNKYTKILKISHIYPNKIMVKGSQGERFVKLS